MFGGRDKIHGLNQRYSPTDIHPLFCRPGPGIGLGRYPTERRVWVLLWPAFARHEPSSLCFGYSSEAPQQPSGSGARLRVQAFLHSLDQGVIVWGRDFLAGVRGTDGSKRSVDTVELCTKTTFSLGNTQFSPNTPKCWNPLDSEKTLKPFRRAISHNYFPR